MKLQLATALSLLIGVGLSANAFADDPPKKKPKKAKKALVEEYSGAGYGSAGCGLGSIVFGPKPGMVQVFAATTNGTALNQSFGISSGTSNCDIPEMGQQAAVFIEVNKEIVQKDAARGEGETIRALADILDCGSAEKLGEAMKSNFGTYFAHDINAYETVRRLFNSGVCMKEGV